MKSAIAQLAHKKDTTDKHHLKNNNKTKCSKLKQFSQESLTAVVKKI
jgi:hypothetical protein